MPKYILYIFNYFGKFNSENLNYFLHASRVNIIAYGGIFSILFFFLLIGWFDQVLTGFEIIVYRQYNLFLIFDPPYPITNKKYIFIWVKEYDIFKKKYKTQMFKKYIIYL